MTEDIEKKIVESTSFALATNGPEGVNVVPLSVVEVHGEEIWFFDFFMGKTAVNLQQNSMVAFTCWQGFVGLQIKGRAVYETDGEVFKAQGVVMKERFPDRTLRAVIRLTPDMVYDVAPGATGENILM
ncbi:pyridoxamine 5'-phosphate oxidase family protein [Candidatus Kaiserbacteria bacterium]|nr:pyridoxamine 5'-phosphate oxidase family protein [Candidatus Kaiserbacteria bacterium]